MHLYAPVNCDPAAAPGTQPAGTTCTLTTTAAGNNYYLTNADGSYRKGPELNDPYVTERWLRPINCVAIRNAANAAMRPKNPNAIDSGFTARSTFAAALEPTAKRFRSGFSCSSRASVAPT